MGFKIPLFDLNYDTKEEAAVLKTLRSRWISNGPKTAEFERKFSSMIGTPYSVALANCTVALHLALRILGIKSGDEVIVPSLTFVATVNAVHYVNAQPVFCDIVGRENLTIDPQHLSSLITRKTKAVIVMHYAGFPCEMHSIMGIARRHKIKVIEDASHAPLSECNGAIAGTIGDIGCFSFFSNKNISTGEGGMLITADAGYYERARLLRSHGMTTTSYERYKGHSSGYDVVDLGYNFRLDDIRASLGIVQLDKLKKDLKRRAEIRKIYLEKLDGMDGIVVPFASHHEFVSNYIFPVILSNSTFSRRDKVRDILNKAGIQTSVHYPAVHKFGFYKNCRANLPETEYAADNQITLPMHAGLSDVKIGYIANALKKALQKAER